MSMESGKALPKGWRWVQLKDICEINPRRSALDRPNPMPTTFVPMEAVDDVTGKMNTSRTRPYAEIKKGYTYFQEDDIVFAKITPCMENGKHAVAKGLVDGIAFGTTEFHVIRPGPDIDARWVHSYLRRPEVLRTAKKHFTGAVGQRRVPALFLEELEIPLPPLPDQKRIAAILTDRLAAVERARKASQARLDAAFALPAAYLREVFKSEGALECPTIPLGELVVSSLRTGISKPEKADSTSKCLTLSAVRNGSLLLDRSKPVDVTSSEAKRNQLKSGAFYVVRGNGNKSLVGRGGIAPVQCNGMLFPDLLFEVNPNPEALSTPYLRWAWDSERVRSQIEEKSKTAAGIFKINQQHLAAIELPVPSLETQKRIATILEGRLSEVGNMQSIIANELSAITAIPAALLHQAFSGAL